MIDQLRKNLRAFSDPVRAQHSRRYFRVYPGGYGEGDVFLGLTVPQVWGVARKYRGLPLSQIKKLLHSRIHEERQVALAILGLQFQKGGAAAKKTIYDLYLRSTKYVNNWDLIDGSAPRIVGGYLLSKDWSILKKLARSESLWERRIAILATLAFTKSGDPVPTLEIARQLLSDKHDLIHKAVGWMLREVGKHCSPQILTDFLDSHLSRLPRTTLRYAIERFPESLRREYLGSRV